MGRTTATKGESQLGKIVAEYNDFLPLWELFPALTPEEVERFVALGKAAAGRLREGDVAGAESMFRAQTAIFAANPEPWASLALLAASHGDERVALERMRAAVLRGFTDLRRIERAEAWLHLRRHLDFLRLQDAVPLLVEAERKWAGWEAVRTVGIPASIDAVIRGHAQRGLLLDSMAPALGPRHVRLWKRLNDRVASGRLEDYVAAHPEAPEVGEALDRLMLLYSGGGLVRWELLPADAARRLGKVASVALERFEEGPMRPGALVCRALARYSERDRKGAFPAGVVEEIRTALDEVLARHASSPFVALAAEGQVRTETEAGRPDLAARTYRAFRERHAKDRELLDEVRDRLGQLALRVGGIPDFRALALDGGAVEREALAGKVVVLDFWATWCGPCLEQLPTLRRIEERFGDRVLLLGVNLDRADELSAQELRDWLAREPVPGRQLHDGLGWNSQIVEAFGVREIPFSVVAGPRGEVLTVGERGKGLEKAVESALRK